mmetsp:Transcript_11317/g.28657  ORF Transcript_11317/g.28657 Transcript_11317/m.28657 type:complete len:239 (-) Transcript_11317:760-1476(-)
MSTHKRIDASKHLQNHHQRRRQQQRQQQWRHCPGSVHPAGRSGLRSSRGPDNPSSVHRSARQPGQACPTRQSIHRCVHASMHACVRPCMPQVVPLVRSHFYVAHKQCLALAFLVLPNLSAWACVGAWPLRSLHRVPFHSAVPSNERARARTFAPKRVNAKVNVSSSSRAFVSGFAANKRTERVTRPCGGAAAHSCRGDVARCTVETELPTPRKGVEAASWQPRQSFTAAPFRFVSFFL